MITRIWLWLIKLLGFYKRKWHIENGVPVSYGANDLPFFWFPATSPGANYLLTETDGAISNPITLSYTIQTEGDVVFDFHTNPNNQGTAPSSARLIIQRKGDNWSGQGEYEHYRFWSTVGVQRLAAGSYVLSASLDPAQWTSVYGRRGADVPDAFFACLKEAEYVGCTFGGGSFYGHGIFVPNGRAMFRVDSISY